MTQPEGEEEEIVANFALGEIAGGGAPEEFPLDTGDSPEVELPPEDNEQDLEQVQASPEPPVAEGDEARA